MELTREAKERRYIIITLMTLIIILVLIPFIFGCTTFKADLNRLLPDDVTVTSVHEAKEAVHHDVAMFMMDASYNYTRDQIKYLVLSKPFYIYNFFKENGRYNKCYFIINQDIANGIWISRDEVSIAMVKRVEYLKSLPKLDREPALYYSN